MTPNDLFLISCIFSCLSLFTIPKAERRTNAPAKVRTKSRKAKKRKSPKRTKAKKEKRYKPPPLSVEDQIRYDNYKLKQSGITWNSGEYQ